MKLGDRDSDYMPRGVCSGYRNIRIDCVMRYSTCGSVYKGESSQFELGLYSSYATMLQPAPAISDLVTRSYDACCSSCM